MERAKLPPAQKKIALVSFIFCPVLILMAVPFIFLMGHFTSIDENYTALLELTIIAPLALYISVKLYDNKVRPFLEKKNENKGGR
jgi:hypothetical protein